MYRQGFFSHHQPPNSFKTAAADASGNATGFLGPCPGGYCWYVENLNMHIPDSGVLDMFSVPQDRVPLGTAWDMGGRFDHFAAATDDVHNYAQAIYVPEGYYVVASLSGATTGDVATVTVQIAVHQLAGPITTPVDAQLVEESRLPVHSILNIAAVGERVA